MAKRVPGEQLARVLRDLLKNYWRPDEAPEEQARHIALMVQDLGGFPEPALAWALREWRTGSTKRPSTADLFQLAAKRQRDIEARRDHLFEQDRLAAEPGPIALTDAEMDERRLGVERIMSEAGFQRRKHGWISGAEAREEKIKAARVPHWSETAAPDDPRFDELRAARAKAKETDADRRRELGETREAGHGESDAPDWDQRVPPAGAYDGEVREGRA